MKGMLDIKEGSIVEYSNGNRFEVTHIDNGMVTMYCAETGEIINDLYRSAQWIMVKGLLRKYAPELERYLIREDFFNAPASTKYHGSYHGGLLNHCIEVFHQMCSMKFNYLAKWSMREMVVFAFGHDVCKLGAYLRPEDARPTERVTEFKWNPEQPGGHSKLSIDRLSHYITLTDRERTMIRYHMGSYGADGKYAEYTLEEMHQAFKDNDIQMAHLADMMAAKVEAKEEAFQQAWEKEQMFGDE